MSYQSSCELIQINFVTEIAFILTFSLKTIHVLQKLTSLAPVVWRFFFHI